MSELCNITLGQLLKRNAAANPERPAIEYCGKSWTWGEFDKVTDLLAMGLLARGVKRGCNIGIIASDSPSFVIFMSAVHKIGGVCVLFNPSYTKSELQELICFTNVEYLATGTKYKDIDLRDLTGCMSEIPLMKEIFYIDEDTVTSDFEALCKAGSSFDPNLYNNILNSVDPGDTATILFTSGTTGDPKAVMITHYAQVNTSITQAEDLGASMEDKFCVAIPMFHCFCLSTTVFAAFAVSGCICIPESLRTVNVIKTLSESRCTVLNSVPSLFFALIARPDFKNYDISALRTGFIGGAGYTAEQFKNIEESFSFRLLSSLGMTEATGGVTVTYPEDSLQVRSTTVGHFMKNVTGSICDITTGEELKDGETGEICISGFMVMKGYYKQPELTAKAIDSKGRLHSGDLGFIDENKNLHITGRIKELINRGGEKISPFQIEACLTANDSRIKLAKAIGIPDPHYGEEICACVVLKEGALMTEDEVREIVNRNLAKYKVPKYVLFFEAFPYNFKGKVTNKVLQEEAIKKLQEKGLF